LLVGDEAARGTVAMAGLSGPLTVGGSCDVVVGIATSINTGR
jgi:hypothetical protein